MFSQLSISTPKCSRSGFTDANFQILCWPPCESCLQHSPETVLRCPHMDLATVSQPSHDFHHRSCNTPNSFVSLAAFNATLYTYAYLFIFWIPLSLPDTIFITNSLSRTLVIFQTLQNDVLFITKRQPNGCICSICLSNQNIFVCPGLTSRPDYVLVKTAKAWIAASQGLNDLHTLTLYNTKLIVVAKENKREIQSHRQ